MSMVRAMVGLLVALSMIASATAAGFPGWAYPPCHLSLPSGRDAVGKDVLSATGSTVHFTRAEIDDWSVVSDWFPGEHSPMPPLVAASRSPKIAACGYCHLPDGGGRPENAKLSGLPAGYIVAQVHAFQTGRRQAALTEWAPSKFMSQSVAHLPDEDLASVAEYFSHQGARSFVRVIERSMIPEPVIGCAIYMPASRGEMAVNSRIIEMPAEVEPFDRRDPHTAYVAYVPMGSIARGRALAHTGGSGRTQPCAACHGQDLRGDAKLAGPPLAGRFPSYLFRQLYGFRSGVRQEDSARIMESVVTGLSQSDMIDLAAYAASLKP